MRKHRQIHWRSVQRLKIYQGSRICSSSKGSKNFMFSSRLTDAQGFETKHAAPDHSSGGVVRIIERWSWF
jgi:hypothetical protein